MRLAANGRWGDGTILALLLSTSLFLQAGFIATPADADDEQPVGILFAPWVDAGEAMQRVGEAGARIVRFGFFPFIVVAQPDRPRFESRIRERGALMILDPRVLAACSFPVKP